MEPILRWAGGKRQLIDELVSIIRPKLTGTNRYYEPFIGGGSIAFSLEYPNTTINDYNEELINVYEVVKKDPYKLLDELKKHDSLHSKEYYYNTRSWDRKGDYNSKSDVERAGRIIYLNRACYNGLYRVNSKGHFNVPIGRLPKSQKPDFIMEDRIKILNEYLNQDSVDITCGDFEKCVIDAEEGDVIYFDPPYDYEKEGFNAYVKYGFSHDDLNRLKRLCDNLIERGCFVIISNNDTPFVRDVFSEDRYHINNITTTRFINCAGKKRTHASEVIICGYNR